MKKGLEQIMKKVSFWGVGLGLVLGLIVGLLSGSWIFWLGTGLAIGAILGSAAARPAPARENRTLRRPDRGLLESTNVRGQLNS